MTKYTAADFANARFAEHEDGRIAARLNDDAWPWVADGDEVYDDGDMSVDRWVPFPDKPTITDPEVGDIAEHKTDDWLDGFITGYQKAGGTVLDETPKERTTRLVNEVMKSWGWGDTATAKAITDRLIETGLVKDN